MMICHVEQSDVGWSQLIIKRPRAVEEFHGSTRKKETVCADFDTLHLNLGTNPKHEISSI
jgi:hypothetical protein